MRSYSIKRVLPLIILIVVFSLSIAGLPLFAEEEREGIGISPTKLTLDADPGEQISGQFIVTNPGTKPVDYKLYVKDFSIRNEEYEKDFEPIPGAVSPVSWIQVPDGVRNLASGAQEELLYTITVPTGTVPRGYYAVLFAETDTPEADATGVARLKRVGLLVYLTVNGGSVEKGKVVSFETKGWQSKRPAKTSLRIQNEGNVHFATEGTVYLKDILGRTAAKTEISGTILPATIRKFSPELKLNQPFGFYKISGDVTLLGKKTALAEKWVFVGSPFWLVLLVVIIVGWAFVLIRWAKRRVKRKKR